jgi:hypothetical protein
MAKRPPKTVSINPDDHAARHVGRTADGHQFFLTNPFVPTFRGKAGREFLALYLFDLAGTLLDARIEDLGSREQLDETVACTRRDEMLQALGRVTLRRIKVAPFRIERFGVEFGFVAEPPQEPDEDWHVTVEPGNYMAFYPPWSSGDYDT